MPPCSMRWRPALVVLAGLGLLLLACSPAPQPSAPSGQPGQPAGAPKYGGWVNTGDLRENINKDPWRTGGVQDVTKIAAMYNGLIMYDPLQFDKIIPDLAERWEATPDGRVFTFYLAKNVSFHDGTPMTSADVKATFDRALNPRPELALQRLPFWKPLEKVEAVDPSTVRFTLKKNQPSFLSLLANGWNGILSKKDLEANNGDLGDKQNGTGPFKFVEYTPGVSWTVEKNQNHWKKDKDGNRLPYLDGVKQFILPDDNARLAALRTKQIDLVFSFPGITAAQAETLRRANLAITIQPVVTLVGLDYLTFNVKQKPFDDAKVRRAMSIAVDRPGSIKVARQGNAKLASLFPPGSPWEVPLEEVMKFPGWNPDKAKDIAEAKRLLSEAGYPNGFDGGTMLIRAGQTDEDEGAYLQQEFEKIGIKFQQKKVDSTVFGQLTRQEQFSVYPIAQGNTVDDPDDILFRNYHGGNTAAWFLKDKKADDMIEKQSEMADPAERKKLVLEIQRYIMNEAVPLIPLHYPIRLAPYWPYVKNWDNHPSVYNHTRFETVWLDK